MSEEGVEEFIDYFAVEKARISSRLLHKRRSESNKDFGTKSDHDTYSGHITHIDDTAAGKSRIYITFKTALSLDPSVGPRDEQFKFICQLKSASSETSSPKLLFENTPKFTDWNPKGNEFNADYIVTPRKTLERVPDRVSKITGQCFNGDRCEFSFRERRDSSLLVRPSVHSTEFDVEIEVQHSSISYYIDFTFERRVREGIWQIRQGTGITRRRRFYSESDKTLKALASTPETSGSGPLRVTTKQELDEARNMGYDDRDLEFARLLDGLNSPWAVPTNFYETKRRAAEIPRNTSLAGHYTGCPHFSLATVHAKLFETRGDYVENSYELHSLYPFARDFVASCCGIAGISTSPSRYELKEVQNYVNSVSHDGFLTMTVTYPDYDIDLVEYIRRALDSFHIAVNLLQSRSICCNSFTIAQMTQKSSLTDPISIELRSIDFSLTKAFMNSIPHRTFYKTPTKQLHTCLQLALEVIGYHGLEHDEIPAVEQVWHYSALASQLLNLGLLSFSQMHCGMLEPCCLMEPLKEVFLRGTGQRPESHIKASPVKMACLGDMLRDELFVFQPVTKSDKSSVYPLLTSAVAFCETWPSSAVIDSTAKPPNNLVAINVRDGALRPTGQVPDPMKPKTFHWQEGNFDSTNPPHHIQRFSPTTPLLIGMDVTHNRNCEHRETERLFFYENATDLGNIGTHRTRYRPSDRNLGASLGYAGPALTVVQSFMREEMTLKSSRVPSEPSIPPDFQGFMRQNWGLQVSMCTGLARRVPLNKLLSPLISKFAKNSTLGARGSSSIPRLWGIDFFAENLDRNDEFRFQRYSLIWAILGVLKNTGFAPEGDFVILAADDEDAIRSIKLNKKNVGEFLKVVADSHDSAVFASFDPACWQAGESCGCRAGKSLNFKERGIPMLSTAVTFDTREERIAGGPYELQHGGHYWMTASGRPILAKVTKNESWQLPHLCIIKRHFLYRFKNIRPRPPGSVICERDVVSGRAKATEVLISSSEPAPIQRSELAAHEGRQLASTERSELPTTERSELPTTESRELPATESSERSIIESSQSRIAPISRLTGQLSLGAQGENRLEDIVVSGSSQRR